MNQYPTRAISQEEKLRRMDGLYRLMGEQVKSYHRAHHMGDNSSVPVELAQELMESMVYTLDQSDSIEGSVDAAQGLEKGRKILEQKYFRAKELLRLADATAPSWQGEGRWEALVNLGRYLQCYDLMHLAHKIPDGIYYPLPIEPPVNLRGIDHALFFLQMIWIENQIMDAFAESALEEFWSYFCQNDRGLFENQCEQLTVNAIGKWLASRDLASLLVAAEELDDLVCMLKHQGEAAIVSCLEQAACQICGQLRIRDPNVIAYMKSVIGHVMPRLEIALTHNCLNSIFIA